MLIVLAVLAAYGAAGWWSARRDLPNAWERARTTWGWGRHDDEALASVKLQTMAMFLFWPVLIPGRAVNRRLGEAVVDADPVAREKKITEQQSYIEELERKLGIGGER